VTHTVSPINAANLKDAHRIAESRTAIGKTTPVGLCADRLPAEELE